jgi:hypothetical protein
MKAVFPIGDIRLSFMGKKAVVIAIGQNAVVRNDCVILYGDS